MPRHHEPGLTEIELPDGLFLADMFQGSRSIKADGAVTINESPEPLQIILGRNPGSIRGRVQSSENRVPSDTTVVLLPDAPLRANAMLYRSGRPSASGAFELKNIAPGSYKLFAWEGVLSTAWMNAEFVKPYEGRGMPIVVEQKDVSDVVVNVIDR